MEDQLSRFITLVSVVVLAHASWAPTADPRGFSEQPGLPNPVARANPRTIVDSIAFAPPTLTHLSPVEAEKGKPLTITATVTGNEPREATVYYRTPGREYIEAPMTASDTTGLFTTTISESFTRGDFLDYYIEAVAASVATDPNGTADSPNRVVLKGSRFPVWIPIVAVVGIFIVVLYMRRK
jgi:hypothetical protein